MLRVGGIFTMVTSEVFKFFTLCLNWVRWWNSSMLQHQLAGWKPLFSNKTFLEGNQCLQSFLFASFLPFLFSAGIDCLSSEGKTFGRMILELLLLRKVSIFLCCASTKWCTRLQCPQSALDFRSLLGIRSILNLLSKLALIFSEKLWKSLIFTIQWLLISLD